MMLMKLAQMCRFSQLMQPVSVVKSEKVLPGVSGRSGLFEPTFSDCEVKRGLLNA